MRAEQIVCIARTDGFARFVQALYVRVGKKAAVIGGDAEHPLSAPAYGVFVAVDEFVDALERGFVVGVPEPVELAERSVYLDGPPAQIAVAVDDVPVLVVDAAGLGACPADVAVLKEGGIGEDHGVGLIGAQGLD